MSDFSYLTDQEEEPLNLAERLTADAPIAPGPGRVAMESELFDPQDGAHSICSRGPCCHRFSVLARYRKTESFLTVQHATSCIAAAREIDLTDENFYRCSQWKPVQLAWLPNGVWAALRPLVTKVYEKLLLSGEKKPDWLKKLEDLATQKEKKADFVPAGMKLPEGE